MLIILGTNDHPMSIAIRETTNSQYSHVAILDNGEVIEANPVRGVCVTTLKLFNKHYPINTVRQMDGDVDRARALIGKPYDYLGLAGQAYNNNDVQDPHKFLCTELLAVAANGINSLYGHMLKPDHFIALSWELEDASESTKTL